MHWLQHKKTPALCKIQFLKKSGKSATKFKCPFFCDFVICDTFDVSLLRRLGEERGREGDTGLGKSDRWFSADRKGGPLVSHSALHCCVQDHSVATTTHVLSLQATQYMCTVCRSHSICVHCTGLTVHLYSVQTTQNMLKVYRLQCIGHSKHVYSVQAVHLCTKLRGMKCPSG